MSFPIRLMNVKDYILSQFKKYLKFSDMTCTWIVHLGLVISFSSNRFLFDEVFHSLLAFHPNAMGKRLHPQPTCAMFMVQLHAENWKFYFYLQILNYKHLKHRELGLPP